MENIPGKQLPFFEELKLKIQVANHFVTQAAE